MKKTPAPIQTAKDELSVIQRKVLVAIRDHIWEKQLAPTYDEVAARISGTKSNARRVIALLVSKGFLGTAPGMFRNIVITPRGYQAAAKKVRS